jgi:hypothetical protein
VQAFDKLKALLGDWTAIEAGQEFAARIEAISGGTAVLQRSGFVGDLPSRQ